MAVSFEQLEAFVATHKCGSFSAAARYTGKAQSVMSTLVSNLEIDLGVDLFDRSHRYPILTPAGESLIGRASGVVEQRERLIVAADELLANVETKLTIAIENQITIENLGHVLKQLIVKHPYVDIEIDYGTVQDVWRRVSNDTAQLGIVIQPENPLEGVDFRGVGVMEFVCVASEEHPLSQLKQVSWEDLKQHRQILIKGFEDSSMTKWQASFQIWQVANVHGCFELVSEGIGWAVLPRYVLKDTNSKQKIVNLPLSFDSRSSFAQEVDLIWSDNKALGPAAKFITEQLSDLMQVRN
ncbi:MULTISPECIES: LysR family transcriptional regulator [unclassified Pseudoalteromonas]|uniref:LysR family transcriptional regulator n=1 Tax=unclassified Pseudoalteromonas TaxID=194690 RepID=UPI0020973282|nr:LysR family transcriptional regulator [Pseudoalteromonas sp. XMcav2-N]MCO7188628.1 LysR family transcriptional regulator [Pseudoalteromonas sp. XMcav2-N]